jgi:hypothetical protein
MARVRFLRDFNWHVPEYAGRVTIAYKAGSTETVKQRCADDAIAAGAAEKIAPRPAPAPEDSDGDDRGG